MWYNMSINKKIQNFHNLNQKITSLNVLQDFMNTISEVTSVDEKIKKIGFTHYLYENEEYIEEIRKGTIICEGINVEEIKKIVYG